MPMNTRSLSCMNQQGFHRVAYHEWEGRPGAPTVLCVHGLTRNGRDFDTLAEALSPDFRVVCPDVVGRGRSDWLGEAAGYGYPQYLSDMTALIARLDVEDVRWVGTSMGGLIGMLMAALRRAPISRMVINDIGPLVAKEGIARIAGYVGQDPSFADLDALEGYLRQVSASFGKLTDEQWHHMATHASRNKPDGTLGLAYDPKIGNAFRAAPAQDVDLWPQWDRVSCPTLVLRGRESDLLRAEDAKAMAERGPRAKLIEFAGIGHAPALMSADQIAAVRDFIAG